MYGWPLTLQYSYEDLCFEVVRHQMDATYAFASLCYIELNDTHFNVA